MEISSFGSICEANSAACEKRVSKDARTPLNIRYWTSDELVGSGSAKLSSSGTGISASVCGVLSLPQFQHVITELSSCVVLQLGHVHMVLSLCSCD